MTAEDMAYNTGRRNLSEYKKSGIADKFPRPTKKELMAVIHDTIESYSDGVWGAGWEIHCYRHLLDMLKWGAAK